MENQKESKKAPALKDKIETIYEILSIHKVDIEHLEQKINEVSVIVDKVKGRMGI